MEGCIFQFFTLVTRLLSFDVETFQQCAIEVHLSVCLSACLFVYLFFYPSVCLSVHLSFVCLSVTVCILISPGVFVCII